ncbi:ATP-grasp domain-containing protein [Roseimicrobium gellanilyticum]|uniref:ATP-grasp domain-containing protein n=1 Tax=Roseimicrobium gellanilyticum TaxID=748857 RepID=A0A366HNJ0_9BACT|nr:ATP-grasp domain-containing protein [Roseimicrobium gellanilyticum]RBP44603.1 ATP-grasp domain-containing protein [Roseimicrobium gellanilyticum]
MAKHRVWFSRASSSLHPALLTLKQRPLGGDLEIYSSHSQWDSPALCASDVALLEPAELKGNAYVQWCLDFCREHRIDVFVPGGARSQIADRREEFASVGTRILVAADGPTLKHLEDKSGFLAGVPPEIAPIARYVTVNTAAEFADAVTTLQATCEKVCFKPSQSIFGLGFYVLKEGLQPVNRLLDGYANVISFEEAHRILATQEKFRDVLVMEYLPGNEYSVDCVGRRGELVCAIVRAKLRGDDSVGSSQLVQGNPEVEQMARAITHRYGLDGLYNMQFREGADGGRPKLLEVNGRMSGGMALACLTGIHLLELAIQVTLAGPDAPLPEVRKVGSPVRAQQAFSAFPAVHVVSQGSSTSR